MRINNPLIPFPTLKTKNLTLRKIEYTDIHDIYSYAQNPEVAKYVLWEPHEDKSDTFEFLNAIYELYNHGKPAPWGIFHNEDKKIIGTIGYHRWEIKHYCAEIGYALSKEYWNKGIITEAALRIIEFGFNEMKLNRIEARCQTENTASAKVLQKIGFTYEGLLREQMFVKNNFQNLMLFSLLKGD
jgi:ribosomal-protein-alanine N-acetyltransferase